MKALTFSQPQHQKEKESTASMLEDLSTNENKVAVHESKGHSARSRR